MCSGLVWINKGLTTVIKRRNKARIRTFYARDDIKIVWELAFDQMWDGKRLRWWFSANGAAAMKSEWQHHVSSEAACSQTNSSSLHHQLGSPALNGREVTLAHNVREGRVLVEGRGPRGAINCLMFLYVSAVTKSNQRYLNFGCTGVSEQVNPHEKLQPVSLCG